MPAGAVRKTVQLCVTNNESARITLSVNCLSLAEEHHLPTGADGCKKGPRVGNAYLLGHWADDPLLGRADIEAHEPMMKMFYIAHNSLKSLGGAIVGEESSVHIVDRAHCHQATTVTPTGKLRFS